MGNIVINLQTVQLIAVAAQGPAGQRADMANIFYAQESGSVNANSTFHGAWRSTGSSIGELAPYRTFGAQVGSNQPVTAWIEYGDDGSTPLGATAPAILSSSGNVVPLSIPVCAEYFRIAINNPPGSSTASITVKESFNG